MGSIFTYSKGIYYLDDVIHIMVENIFKGIKSKLNSRVERFSKLNNWLCLSINVLLLVVGVVLYFSYFPDVYNSVKVIILIAFFTPILLDFSVISIPDTSVLNGYYIFSCLIVGTLGYIISFLIYLSNPESWAWVILPAIFVVLVTLTLLFTSWLIIRSPSPNYANLAALKDQMENHPGVCLMLFISLFLSMTFLLTFNYAFCDSYYQGRALVFNGGTATVDTTSNQTMYTSERSGRLGVWRVLFQEASSKIEIDEEKGGATEIDKNDRKSYKIERIIETSNSKILSEVCKKLNGVKYHGREFRINILGYTSNATVSDSIDQFSSNYELGQARARGVLLHLVDCMDDSHGGRPPINKSKVKLVNSNFEWNTMSAVNKKSSSFESLASKLDSLKGELDVWPDPQKSAEIIIDQYPQSTSLIADVKMSRKSDEMDLLDYFYFATYTITTTGYGDIRPNKPVMKAMTTVTNLLEVLFIAIFFNLFLAFAQSSEGSSAESTEPGDGNSESADGDDG